MNIWQFADAHPIVVTLCVFFMSLAVACFEPIVQVIHKDKDKEEDHGQK